MTKGQMTMTIIVSLMVICLFAVAFYITSRVVVSKVETGQTRQQQGTEAVKPLFDYVGSCLDESGKQGLALLGKQGGKIYASQGGASPDGIVDQDFAQVEQTKLSYGISAPNARLGPFFVSGSTENYPWKEYPLLPTGGEYYDGFYGINTLPALVGDASAQKDLEKFIESSMQKCLDFRTFTDRGIEVSVGSPVATVLFADRNVQVSLNLPTEVKTPTGVSSEQNSYVHQYPVRLKSILEFAHALANRDVGNIRYDASRSAVQADPAMVVSVDGATVGYSKIRIIDSASRLADKSYAFEFARANRQPALHFLQETRPVCIGSNLSQDGSTLRIESCQGVYTVPIVVDDPDEEVSTIKVESSENKALPYKVNSFPDSVLIVTVTDKGGKMDQQKLSLAIS